MSGDASTRIRIAGKRSSLPAPVLDTACGARR
jgi:hypothetical protein